MFSAFPRKQSSVRRCHLCQWVCRDQRRVKRKTFYEHFGVWFTDAVDESATTLDFSKFRDINNQNYTYFSAETGLLQAHALHTLQWKYSTSKTSSATTSDFSDLIFKSKRFCLGIVNPTEDDLALLKTHLHVHDLTLRDIREQNTDEKVEVFKNYTFISLKVYLEAAEVNFMHFLLRISRVERFSFIWRQKM